MRQTGYKQDSVGSLLQDMQALSINEQRTTQSFTNANEYKINKLNSKLSDTES